MTWHCVFNWAVIHHCTSFPCIIYKLTTLHLNITHLLLRLHPFTSSEWKRSGCNEDDRDDLEADKITVRCRTDVYVSLNQLYYHPDNNIKEIFNLALKINMNILHSELSKHSDWWISLLHTLKCTSSNPFLPSRHLDYYTIWNPLDSKTSLCRKSGIGLPLALIKELERRKKNKDLFKKSKEDS